MVYYNPNATGWYNPLTQPTRVLVTGSSVDEKSLLATHVIRTTWASVALIVHQQSIPHSYTALPVWLDESRDPAGKKQSR